MRIKADFLRCTGCSACVVACQQEHRLPAGVQYRQINRVNQSKRNGLPVLCLSHACRHCTDPICAKVCPNGVYYRNDEGVVLRHEEKCEGCGRCRAACPHSSIQFHTETNRVAKCQLCGDRRQRGEQPACLSACPTEALSLVDDESADDDLQAVMRYLRDKGERR